jgi:WD40 repeat protein
MASASDDGTIRLFDTRSWCEVRRFDNKEMTEGIAFSPDGSLLAAATFEQVRLWHVPTSTEAAVFKIRPATSPKVFADAGERNAQLWRMAWRVAFSPDGKLLATGSSAAIQLWDVAKGREVTNADSGGQTGSLHFTPDGRWVVWGNDRNEVVQWNPSTGKRYRFKNEFSLGDTAMTPDGKLILSPGAGQAIAVYDLSSRKKIGDLRCQNAQ